MIHRYSTFIKAINLTFDYIMLNVSMLIGWYIVNYIGVFPPVSHSLIVAVGFNLLWCIASNITALYKHMLVKDSIITFRSLINTYLLFIGFICFAVIVSLGTENYFVGRPFLFYSLIVFGFLLTIWKLIFLAIRKTERASLMNTRTFVIVGGGKTARDLYNFFENNPELGYKLKGYFHDEPLEISYPGVYVGPSLSGIGYAIENQIDEIFCTLPNSESDRIEALMAAADKNLIRFKFVPEYFDFERRPTYIENFGHIPVISVRPEPLENMLNRFVKRLFDCVFSLLIILLVCSWLFPVLAILIKIGSKGPVFFTQMRSGRDNRPFKCYKLRSMRLHSDPEDKQAERGDYRVTKLGAFMRRTSIDELPQFFNVLIGNMSVVGPRPHMISHTEQYAELIDKFMVRQFLKPGITGYAQVNGLRGETKTTEAMLLRVEADVWYLENWSFLLDMKIIFLTIWNLAKGDKNAF